MRRLRGRGIRCFLLLACCLLSRTAWTYLQLPRADGNGAPAPGRRSLSAVLLSLPLSVEAEVVKGGSGASRNVVLNDGLQFPKASFGLQVYDDETAERLTLQAIEAGYRNFFASVLAGNQKGFARAVQKSGVPREEFFICGSVLSNLAQDFDDAYSTTKEGCDKNLEALAEGGITKLDMILLDYPAKDCETIRGQWKAFEEMKAAKQTKSLAVSNFSPEQLDCILCSSGSSLITKIDATKPVLNQLPYSPKNYDAKAVEENGKRGILVQAWGPLGSGSLGISASSASEEIGQKYGKSAAQVALRWILQTGATFTTQSKKKEHMEENLNIFDFELSQEEVNKLSDISQSMTGKLSAAADIIIPVGGAVGGAALLSSFLDSWDKQADQNDSVIRAKMKKEEEEEKAKAKRKKEEEEEEDDGAL